VVYRLAGAGPHYIRAVAEALGRRPVATRPTCRSTPISAPTRRSPRPIANSAGTRSGHRA